MLLPSKLFIKTMAVWRLHVGDFTVTIDSGHHDRVPSAHAINTWIHNFEETGSAMKKKPPEAACKLFIFQTISKLFKLLS